MDPIKRSEDTEKAYRISPPWKMKAWVSVWMCGRHGGYLKADVCKYVEQAQHVTCFQIYRVRKEGNMMSNPWPYPNPNPQTARDSRMNER